jgi:CotH kinase protein
VRSSARYLLIATAISLGLSPDLGCSSHDTGKHASARPRRRDADSPRRTPLGDAGEDAAPNGDPENAAAPTAAADGGEPDASVGPEEVADSGPGGRGDPAKVDSAVTEPAVTDSGRVDSGEVEEPPVVPEAVTAEPQDDARYVFDQSVLRTYNLSIAEEDLALIDMSPASEVYVNGVLEVDGETYGPLGVRYKGSVGGFLAPCTVAGQPGARPGPKTGKCSIKVDFDRVDPNARFHGLKKLNFHSMNRDKSMLRDRLGYAMFRESGIAAPRTAHARLFINGKLEGLYVVVEQIDGRFTHSRFTDGGDGNLYKEVWPVSDDPKPYLAALETNDTGNASVDKMLRFAQAVDLGADASFQWLEPKYLFDYIAVDRVIINDDGAFHWYCSRNHNFYWYEGERADRFWLIPWDLDSSFQNGTFVHIDAPWNEPAAACSCRGGTQRAAICDPLTSQWARRNEDYERAVDAFIAGPFAARNVDAKLAAWGAQIELAVQEASGVQGAPTYGEWQQAYATLQSIIASTRQHRGYAYDAQETSSP